MLTSSSDRETFDRISDGRGTKGDFKKYLSLLIQALYDYHKVKPVVLIDEYDVPLNTAHQNKCYDFVVDIISAMFSKGLKTNDNLQAGVITGCLLDAKNQIFTGLNNPGIYSVTNPVYAQYFGFTKEETAALLHSYGLDDRADDVKDNYDGYNIGKYSIYNPFSLLKFIESARCDHSSVCRNYWAATSGDALLREMLASSAGKELRNTFEKLLSGSSVENVHVDDTIVYSTMMENDAAIIGTLLFSGYLTVVQAQEDGTYTLRIPNREVLTCFKELVSEYNDEVTEKQTPYLISKLLRGDIRNAQKYVNDLISSVLVIRDKDTSENNFHYFLAAILAMTKIPKWEILSRDQGRKGFADFALVSTDNKAIIIEEKVTKELKEMEGLFAEGEKQIEENAYAEKYAYLGYDLYKYVIVYFEMRAYIRKV